jgi:pilus assembly protein CpaC
MQIKMRLLIFAILSWPTFNALAQPQADLQAGPSQNIPMEVGQTRLIRISAKVIRVSVADPNVSDVQVVTPQQVLITAKAVGYTHLILWGVDDQPLVIAVSVTRNLGQLRSQYAELFPNEKITVSAVGDLIVLSGTVSDLRVPARAAELAQLHAEKLANLLQVSGDQQVQLDVRFAEVSRSGMRRAGINFLWQDDERGRVGGMNTNLTSPGSYIRIPGTGNPGGPPVVSAPSSGDAFNLFFSTGLSRFPFSAILSILSQEGLAKVLAEPTLVALSGQKAEFHAGGEVPILIGGGLGQASVEYKKFGVRLNFTPTVLSERTLSLKLGIEVSELDGSSSVLLAGFEVPGFKTRASDTTVRLKDGQSFAIAGLLSDSMRSVVSKVPLLGDLPILGALFSSKSYQRNETELLMVVTAHLVKPLTPNEVPLMPGEDEYNDPSDFELFLLGVTGSDKVEARDEQKDERPEPTAAEQEPVSSVSSGQEKESPKGELRVIEPEKKRSPRGAPRAKPRTSEQDNLEGPLGPIGFVRG